MSGSPPLLSNFEMEPVTHSRIQTNRRIHAADGTIDSHHVDLPGHTTNTATISSSATEPLLPAAMPPEQTEKATSQQYTVNLLLFRRLRRIAHVLHQSGGRIALRCLLLLSAKLASEGVFYYSGKLPSEFYRVLGDRDRSAFFPLLVRCFLIVALAGACQAALALLSGLLGVHMRVALTAYTHRSYVSAGVLYPVVSRGLVDNPDQRVTQDIERLTGSLATILPELLIAPFLIAYYTVKCWAMSGVIGPLSIYFYFVLGVLISRCAMPPVIRQVYLLERAEGDFRFAHLRMAEFAESIAFFSGESREQQAIDANLHAVATVQRRLLGSQFWLSMVTQVFSYLGSTVSYLNAFVSLYLIYRFSVVIEQTRKLTDVAGFTARIVQLWEEIDGMNDNRYVPPPMRTENGEEYSQTQQQQQQQQQDQLVADSLTVCTPGGIPLVRDLNLVIRPGESLIITGANGLPYRANSTGTSSSFSSSPAVFFLPQTPYIIAGSLRAQITYPCTTTFSSSSSSNSNNNNNNNNNNNDSSSEYSNTWCSDADITQLLSLINLTHIIDTLKQAVATAAAENNYMDKSIFDCEFPVQFWLKALSPGEQQKMSLGRVFWCKPLFAVLDECTSSLDIHAEEEVYRLLVENGVTLVSVGHREELWKYHRRRLHLVHGGRYELSDI
ncbi:ABC transporter transmembrane region 2-domain-containing protein [Kickxella alabastrina]|uniref:ABC transporter transmembrane region 2-domain-containing protein n=1 Tax=Kickxella alabastrina TaxID=61397 RepID=UPI002220F82E|nr:ABC transporter transmembrane region 2-domain-containing protein [Kickxella alabastrina]KAI7829114.1 ABC transporter transmembrane region 2-domain-containing protein [Kickxella alabastrina]